MIPATAFVGLALCCANIARAQAPGLLWSTNIGARLFAVDAQTNVYVATNGEVIRLDSSGLPVQTNILSSLPGHAQRDSVGNFYYAGVNPTFFDGAFYDYTTPPCFLAKYSSSGSLIWSNAFGPIISLRRIVIDDLQVDTNGNAYVGFTYFVSTSGHNSSVAKFDNTSSNLWAIVMPRYGDQTTLGSVSIANVSVAGGYALTYDSHLLGGWDATLSRFDSNGTPTIVASWLTSGSGFPPVFDSQGNFYDLEGSFVKRNPSGEIIWSRDLTAETGALVGPDLYDGAHLVNAEGHHLSRSDRDGNIVWTINIPTNCQQLIVDPSGNRFLSLAGGGVARIGDETFTSPAITSAPQPLTVLAGSNAVLSVGASGSTPLRYFWYFNGSLLSAQSNAPLDFFPAATNQSGSYYVVVSNQVSSVTSAPVQLRVKQVELFIGEQMLTNGTYTFPTNPVITVRSVFNNGSVFYTLDGSAPTFSSTFYTGPFMLFSNATVRAIGYSADFAQSEEADAIDALVTAHHYLVVTCTGGGTVSLNPPGGDYASSTTVAVTATPDSGWVFLYWTGATNGNTSTINLPMHSDQGVRAVFGTTLSTTVAGNGQVNLYPSASIYVYGQVIRLTAVPTSGNYFGAWGNAALGSANPLYFSITNPNPTVSSVFATTSAGQVTLTVETAGRGDVAANPAANIYSTDDSVILTATPGLGQKFVNWTGDATGSQNPLTVTLSSSKVVTANFTGGPFLRADTHLGEGMSTGGFRFTLLSDPDSIYGLNSSTNFAKWQSMGYLTNKSGELQLLDSVGNLTPEKFYQLYNP